MELSDRQDGMSTVFRGPDGGYDFVWPCRAEQLFSQLGRSQKARQARKRSQMAVDIGSEQQKKEPDRLLVHCSIFNSCGVPAKDDQRPPGGGGNGVSRVGQGHSATEAGAAKF